VFLGTILAGAFVHHRRPLPCHLPRPVTLGAGGLLVMAAIALFLSSLRLFRRYL